MVFFPLKYRVFVWINCEMCASFFLPSYKLIANQTESRFVLVGSDCSHSHANDHVVQFQHLLFGKKPKVTL